MSTPFRERNPVKIGAISIAVIIALMVVAFKAGDLPLIGGGDTYHASFSEASGIKPNDEVRIAGVRVGKVTGVDLDGAKVDVTFKVDTPSQFGSETAGRDQGEDPARGDVPLAEAGGIRTARRRTRRSRCRAPSRRTTWCRPSRASPTAPSASTPIGWPTPSTPWPS